VTRSRSDQFDDLVLEAVDRLERRWPDELRDVELAVEDVPPVREPVAEAGIPLGRSFASRPGRAARIVIYRRPVESRARDPRTRGLLVHDVVVERVAELLGLPPEVVDPDYRVEGGESGD